MKLKWAAARRTLLAGAVMTVVSAATCAGVIVVGAAMAIAGNPAGHFPAAASDRASLRDAEISRSENGSRADAAADTPGASATKQTDAWRNKDWTKWTDADCENVLQRSPWVRTATFLLGGETAMSRTHPAWAQPARVRILSALPMREAMLRREQLVANYDKMKGKKREEFDRAHALENYPPGVPKEDAGSIVFEVVGAYPFQNLRADLQGESIGRLDDRPGDALEMLGKTTVQRADCSGPGCVDTDIYFFSRSVNGRPILPAFAGALRVTLSDPIIDEAKAKKGEQQPRATDTSVVEFPFSELVYSGKVEL